VRAASVNDIATHFGPDGVARLAVRDVAAVLGVDPARVARAAGVEVDAMLDQETFVGAVAVLSRRCWSRAALIVEECFPRVACGVVLGLTSPFTTHDVTKAFRAKALATHPDTGGTAEAFCAVIAAREEAVFFAVDTFEEAA